MLVKVTDRGLRIGDSDVPLILGTIHYWRLDPKLWPELLGKIAGMGFGMIETYIPWSVHEIERSRFDFGEKEARKDLDGFLSLCAKQRMWVLVRPGPHINAELTYFGYPDRVLADPGCQAISAQGTPVILPVPPRAFPVPSYASEKFYSEAAVWFNAVCPIIKKHLYPQGAIVAVQADNEMSYFFRTNAYDLDYSEGSRELFHRFLKEKYSEVGALNDTYGTNYLKFNDAAMPVCFDARERKDLPSYLDWAEYKEYYLIHGLRRIRDMLRQRGITGIPITHNYPFSDVGTPFNIPAVERELDIQGFDMYPRRSDYHSLKSGCLAAGAQSRLPFIPEFSSGCWLWFPPVTFEDQQFTTLVIWMHGIRAISYYMLVERERWYGSPILRDGRIRTPTYDFYTRLNSIIKKIGLLDFKHQAKVLLTKPRSYQRLESASTLLDPGSTLFLRIAEVSPEIECSEEKFGFTRPIQIASGIYYSKWYRALSAAQYSFLVGDTDMSTEAMMRYPLQVVPTFEFLGRSEQERLLAYARGGGVLVAGPEVPTVDEKMKPCTILKEGLKNETDTLDGFPGAKAFAVGKGKIVVAGGPPKDELDLRKAVDALAHLAGVRRWFPASDQNVETCYHTSPSGERGIVFVANPTGTARNVSINFDGTRKFTDVWTNQEMEGRNNVSIEMPPFTVRMMEVR